MHSNVSIEAQKVMKAQQVVIQLLEHLQVPEITLLPTDGPRLSTKLSDTTKLQRLLRGTTILHLGFD